MHDEQLPSHAFMTEAQARKAYECAAAILEAREGVTIRLTSLCRKDDTKEAAPDGGTS